MPRFRLPLKVALLLTFLLLAGCREDEEVVQYTAPKRPENRILGAVVPLPRKTWFFKMVGPAAETARHKDDFRAFLKSVRFNNDGKPSWDAPPSWRQGEGGSPLRFATFHIGSGAAAAELTVFELEGGTLENVNRWLGQLERPPLKQADLDRVAEELTVDGATATLVDLTGPGSGKTKMPPFAGAHGGKP
jgi:hypothetical protein